jgi:hypothetical protein
VATWKPRNESQGKDGTQRKSKTKHNLKKQTLSDSRNTKESGAKPQNDKNRKEPKNKAWKNKINVKKKQHVRPPGVVQTLKPNSDKWTGYSTMGTATMT